MELDSPSNRFFASIGMEQIIPIRIHSEEGESSKEKSEDTSMIRKYTFGTPLPTGAVVRPLPAKAKVPMLSTLDGIVMSVRFLQLPPVF